MKHGFLSRYLAGEHAAVWSDLVALGAEVRSPGVRDEALAVARETMQRVRENLITLHGRLLAMDYAFADPEQALILAQPGSVARLDAFEVRWGPLPLSARAFYEAIERVDFRQADEQARMLEGEAPAVGGLGRSAALVMLDLEQIERDARELAEEEPFALGFLATGEYASNDDPKGFALPCPAADAEYYDEGFGPRWFVAELRRSLLQFGGFTMSAYYLRGGTPILGYCRPRVEEILPGLCEGLREF